MRPGNRIDSTNIGLYLAKEPLPEGVTRRQVEKELEEIAEKVKRKVF